MVFNPSLLLILSLSLGLVSGSITLTDPSDYVDLSLDAADNALLSNWNITAILYQTIPITGRYLYNDSIDTSLSHEIFTGAGNDTSVIVITSASQLSLSYSTVLKESGYASNIYQSSFYGANAAINVANGSTVALSHVNVTTHNGAANVYAYGAGTVVSVDHADLYSSGPVAHGLYASGNGTVIGSNVRHYSGGYRSSAFAGDSPAGYVSIYDSSAHTAGVGSAIFYALGSIYAEGVVGVAEKAPILFMDGTQTAELVDVDLTAGLLAGTILFSSSSRQAGASISFTDSKLTVLPETAPGLWFGNTIASARLVSTEIHTASGILVVANYSQVTQDFDHYAGYPDNNDLLPAEASIHVEESTLTGDLVAYNGSSISWSLANYSSWTGRAYSGDGAAYFGVALDRTSNWTLTADTTVTNFTDDDPSLANVESAGFDLYYDSSSAANVWLVNRTVSLTGGGKLQPQSSGFKRE